MSRSNRGTGAVRGMATRSSSRHARRGRPPRPAGFPPFSKALSPTIAYPRKPIAFPETKRKGASVRDSRKEIFLRFKRPETFFIL